MILDKTSKKNAQSKLNYILILAIVLLAVHLVVIL
jgi:hypothetical protein